MKFSDYLIKFFEKKNLKHAFGLTGGGAMHLNDSLARSKKIKFIFTHHEQSASMAAESYYREIGLPSILSVTSGPGGTNSLTGVTGAWIDSIPMFVISGQVQTHHTIQKTNTRQIGVQEINIVDIINKVTKKSIFLKDLKNIENRLEDLYETMLTGRPGPVWLDVPLDMQKTIIEKKKIIKQSYSKKKIIKEKKSFDLRKFKKLINESKKPVIIIGNGIHISKTKKDFLRFNSKFKLPVISSWNASDIMNSDDNCYVGRMGIFGDRASNMTAENSDLIIVLGSRLSIPMIGYDTKKFAKSAKKIIVDIDSFELNKNFLSNVDLKINMCLSKFFKAVNKNNLSKNFTKKSNWLYLVNEWKKNYSIKKEKSHLGNFKKKSKKINSFNFINELSKACHGNESIITDMGTSFSCTMQTFSIKNSNKQRLYTSSGLAAMGFGLPGAIGSSIASPKKDIICITGDGGLMFNIQELQTIKNYNLPIKIFILQNKGYLTMKLMQKKNFKLYVGSEKSSGLTFPNFKKVSFSFGLKYKKLRPNNIYNQLRKILKYKGSLVVEIEMEEHQDLVPRLQNYLTKKGDFINPLFDDLFPPLNKNILIEERKKALNI
jgi:acetolactate synthase-1/2/3 large subunit